MSSKWDLVVLGAGPAGMAGAAAAAEVGLSVAVLDEQPSPGGQVYRDLPAEFAADRAALGPDMAIGDGLRQRLAASGAVLLPERKAWFLRPGFDVKVLAPEGQETHSAPNLLVATGTYERVIPVPGWTLPGVVGLAAATVLLKSQRVLPGQATIVAGVGPLLAAVAASILKGGGKVAAVVDLSGGHDWLRALPALASRPDLLARGAGWMAKIKLAGVPTYSGHAVTRILGTDGVEAVEIAPVDADWKPAANGRLRIAGDAVAFGHGLVPSTDVTRLFGARHAFAAELGGWVPVLDDNLQSSVPGLYVAGDGAGIAGAAAAAERGRLAGLAIAHAAGKLNDLAYAELSEPVRAKLKRAERFGLAMSDIMRLRDGLVAAMPPETIVCRCEDITRAEIDEALDGGGRDVNQVKAWTRCGMGPCQGRMCGEALASLIAGRFGSREAAGQLTGRPPLRPVPYEPMVGQFDYADLKLPAPAPS